MRSHREEGPGHSSKSFSVSINMYENGFCACEAEGKFVASMTFYKGTVESLSHDQGAFGSLSPIYEVHL